MNKKMTGGIENTVAALLTSVLQTEGYELVDVETAGGRRNQILRLLIHKDGGLSLSDCKMVDNAVRPILEVHHLLTEYKQLEIASPGLDRPLKTEADFKRNIGRNVQIQTTSKSERSNEVEGIIADVVDSQIVLEQSSGKTAQLKISQICKGYIQLVW